jgi:hypothetical protein
MLTPEYIEMWVTLAGNLITMADKDVNFLITLPVSTTGTYTENWKDNDLRAQRKLVHWHIDKWVTRNASKSFTNIGRSVVSAHENYFEWSIV